MPQNFPAALRSLLLAHILAGADIDDVALALLLEAGIILTHEFGADKAAKTLRTSARALVGSRK